MAFILLLMLLGLPSENCTGELSERTALAAASRLFIPRMNDGGFQARFL